MADVGRATGVWRAASAWGWAWSWGSRPFHVGAARTDQARAACAKFAAATDRGGDVARVRRARRPASAARSRRRTARRAQRAARRDAPAPAPGTPPGSAGPVDGSVAEEDAMETGDGTGGKKTRTRCSPRPTARQTAAAEFEAERGTRGTRGGAAARRHAARALRDVRDADDLAAAPRGDRHAGVLTRLLRETNATKPSRLDEEAFTRAAAALLPPRGGARKITSREERDACTRRGAHVLWLYFVFHDFAFHFCNIKYERTEKRHRAARGESGNRKRPVAGAAGSAFARTTRDATHSGCTIRYRRYEHEKNQRYPLPPPPHPCLQSAYAPPRRAPRWPLSYPRRRACASWGPP